MARRSGFSLVEVVMALGIVSFALVSLVMLLPIGVKTNKISSEETRASLILTSLEADLRNTHPEANGGKSLLYGLPLPYVVSNSQLILNTTLTPNSLSPLNSIGLTDYAQTVAISSLPPARYQASVIYTKISTANSTSSAPIQARLIVNWPAINTTSVSRLTTEPSVAGFVETYVTFPAP